MNENIQIMLQKLCQDEEAQKKFSSLHDADEAYALALSIQDGYSKDEFIAAMRALHDQINSDLNAEDLVKTAGGVEAEDVGVTAGISAASSAVGTAVASAVAASYITSLAASASISGAISVAVGGAASAAV